MSHVLLYAADKNTSNDNNESLWQTTLDIGAQFLPDYSENGDNKGFNKTRLFVDINIDSRWTADINSTNKNFGVWNAGGSIKLLGTASSDSNASTTPTSFNDVSDTVDASVYVQYVPYISRFGIERELYSEIGIILHGGVRSREKNLLHKIQLILTMMLG